MKAGFGRLGIGLAVVVLACDRDERPWEVVPPAPAPTASADVSNPIPAGVERSEDLQLLAFSFTSAVRNKTAVDRYLQAKPGDRVFAHLTIRNLSGRARRIKLAFVVNGHPRTELELEVGPSWSWRTWGFNTLLPDDGLGELFLRVTTDDGKILTEGRLPIGRETQVGKALER